MINNLVIKLMDRVQCMEGWKWNSDDNGWTGFHIWCVDEGEAWVNVGGRVYHVLEGDIFLFDLSSNHICTHNPQNPLKVTTIYFEGITESGGSKVIRQDSFLCEVIRRAAAYEISGERELARQWILPVLCELFRKEEAKRHIPETVSKACCLIEKAFPEMISLDNLAQELGYSKNQMIRMFRESLGITPAQYVIQKKMEYAKGMLLYTDFRVSEVAYQAGYIDLAYFSKTFKKFTGYSPGEYRKIAWNRE